jgi:PPOX class probable F420-dependent enzyme
MRRCAYERPFSRAARCHRLRPARPPEHINADGSPHGTVIWIERDGDDLLSGHMQWYAKLRNIERDPRVVISFTSRRDPSAFLNPYAVLRAHATIERGEHAWERLDRLTRVYLSPDAIFPAPRAPGYLVRYRIKRIGGVDPWASR